MFFKNFQEFIKNFKKIKKQHIMRRKVKERHSSETVVGTNNANNNNQLNNVKTQQQFFVKGNSKDGEERKINGKKEVRSHKNAMPSDMDGMNKNEASCCCKPQDQKITNANKKTGSDKSSSHSPIAVCILIFDCFSCSYEQKKIFSYINALESHCQRMAKAIRILFHTAQNLCDSNNIGNMKCIIMEKWFVIFKKNFP